MFYRSSLVVLLAACSLLARPTHAEGTPPARRAAAPRLVAPVAAPAAPAPIAAPAPVEAPVALVAAPRTLSLVGTIVDPSGRPCAGVCVFPTFNPRLIAVTDAKGTFRLQVPATTSPLYLQADYVGLGSRRVAVDSEHPQPVSIVLGE